MKTHNSSEKKSNERAKKKDAATNRSKEGRDSNILNAAQTVQVAKGVIDIGKNLASLLTEKERTKQMAIECHRDIVVSNNELEQIRLEMDDNRSNRLLKQEIHRMEHELALRKLNNEENLQVDYLENRKKALSDFRDRKITYEEFQVYMDRIEKGLFE
jgi:hypothetical protein